MEMDKDRTSILGRIERGEISIENADLEFAQALQELDASTIHETIDETSEKGESKKAGIITRRERKFALSEKIQNWEPQMMIGTPDPQPWPWPDIKWQWMWQNFGYPVYVSHSIDIKAGTELHVVLYQGDLAIRSWDQPALKISGAAFDVRTAQFEDTIKIGGSTGQLQIWIPDNIVRVKVHVIPGEVWIRNVPADVEVHCQNGDLVCESIKGKVVARAQGGDIRLIGIDGVIDASVARGNADVRKISSTDVTLKCIEGKISLSLDSIDSGTFLCESTSGDIDLYNTGKLACELVAEIADDGLISPVLLPWQSLIDRSDNKLHGILMGGGAKINLKAKNGKIYIQDPWIPPEFPSD